MDLILNYEMAQMGAEVGTLEHRNDTFFTLGFSDALVTYGSEFELTKYSKNKPEIPWLSRYCTGLSPLPSCDVWAPGKRYLARVVGWMLAGDRASLSNCCRRSPSQELVQGKC